MLQHEALYFCKLSFCLFHYKYFCIHCMSIILTISSCAHNGIIANGLKTWEQNSKQRVP